MKTSQIYCGNNLYELGKRRLGTPYECLKKGVGVGLHADLTNFNPRFLPITPNNEYCGSSDPPPGKILGTPSSCMRKGMGIGMKLQYDRRHNAPHRKEAAPNSRVRRRSNPFPVQFRPPSPYRPFFFEEDSRGGIDSIDRRGGMDSIDNRGGIDNRGSIDNRGTRDRRGSIDSRGTRDRRGSIDSRGARDRRGSIDSRDRRGSIDSRDRRGSIDSRGSRDSSRNSIYSRDSIYSDEDWRARTFKSKFLSFFEKWWPLIIAILIAVLVGILAKSGIVKLEIMMFVLTTFITVFLILLMIQWLGQSPAGIATQSF